MLSTNFQFWNDSEIQVAIAEFIKTRDDTLYAARLYPAFLNLAQILYNQLPRPSLAGEQDDACQEAVIHLTTKLDKFDPSRGNKALTWCWLVMSRQFNVMYRANMTLKNGPNNPLNQLEKVDEMSEDYIAGELGLVTRDDIEDILCERLTFTIDFWEKHASEHFHGKTSLRIIGALIESLRNPPVNEKLTVRYLAKQVRTSHQLVDQVIIKLSEITRRAYRNASALVIHPRNTVSI